MVWLVLEEIADINYCVFVETGDNDSSKVEDIIQEMGGTLEDQILVEIRL